MRKIRCGGAAGGEGLLAGEFGGAVDVERAGGVGLDVGCRLGAVEDVVGGEVDDGGAEAGGLFAEDAGGGGVDGVGEFGLALGLVDGGVGGGVDDPARAGARA